MPATYQPMTVEHKRAVFEAALDGIEPTARSVSAAMQGAQSRLLYGLLRAVEMPEYGLERGAPDVPYALVKYGDDESVFQSQGDRERWYDDRDPSPGGILVRINWHGCGGDQPPTGIWEYAAGLGLEHVHTNRERPDGMGPISDAQEEGFLLRASTPVLTEFREYLAENVPVEE